MTEPTTETMPRVLFSAPATSTKPSPSWLEILVFHDRVHEATLRRLLDIDQEWFVEWYAEPSENTRTRFGTHRDLGRLQQLVQHALAQKHGWATASSPEVHHITTLEDARIELEEGPVAPHRG